MSISSLPQGIYGITDPLLLPGEKLFTGVESALQGGCRIIQYRDKQAEPSQAIANARRLKDLCQQYNAPLIINDSLLLALECDADGLHLGKSDGQLGDARRALGEKKIIGVSCHSDLHYAQACASQGASYCAFGRFFDSKSKPDAPACSMETFRKARCLGIPVLAIGGISIDNIARFSDTPPHNIAVINSLFGQADIYQAAQALSSAFNKIQTH